MELERCLVCGAYYFVGDLVTAAEHLHGDDGDMVLTNVEED